MNNNLARMNEMRLYGMSEAWKTMLETRSHHQLSAEEVMEILLQAEENTRQQNRFSRLTKQARFRYQASIEEINFDERRGLHRNQITDLSMGGYISKGESILVTGATGCGKSFMASALGNKACGQGFKVLYFNTQKLFLQCKMARIDGSIAKFLLSIAKAHLLILDDFGLTHFQGQQQLDLMEIIEDRHGKHATIIVSQLPVMKWFNLIEEKTIADAILDRIVHSAHRIELKGESMRKKR